MLTRSQLLIPKCQQSLSRRVQSILKDCVSQLRRVELLKAHPWDLQPMTIVISALHSREEDVSTYVKVEWTSGMLDSIYTLDHFVECTRCSDVGYNDELEFTSIDV